MTSLSIQHIQAKMPCRRKERKPPPKTPIIYPHEREGLARPENGQHRRGGEPWALTLPQQKRNNEGHKGKVRILRERTCYICGQKGEGWDQGNLYNMNCRKCSQYTLTDLAFRQRLIRGAKKALRNNDRARLSIAVKAEYEKRKRRIYLNAGKIDKLVGRPLKPIRISMT